MSEYLVEVYLSRSAAHGGAPSAHRVAGAADQLSREGRPVRLLQAVFVPDDETCFYLFEAQSDETVIEAARRSGLLYERLVQAVTAPVSLSI
ncbi:MAG TPA: hypothetical protein VKI19_05025 [Acidimicrobiales bacterium]|nr:hypothetical protein [Acidimicrobiales bacterium]